MKKIFLLLTYISAFTVGVKADTLDSLKQQLQLTTDDKAKAIIYNSMADCYLSFKTAPNSYTKRINYENAVNYTMLAMKTYYKYSDTTGMIYSYSNLSRAYRSQRKFAQAKWFILQANTLSRHQKAVPSIINTLVDLAAIKIDIKDYNLAKKDLKEAHRLAMKNKLAEQDSSVKIAYSRLYTFIQVPPAENVFQGLDETIKNEELAYAAKQKKLAALASLKQLKKTQTGKKKLLAATAASKIPVQQIKLTAPTINWETPSSKTNTDSLKTVSL
ncbi:hypothetical protein [Mucilaginibacter aquatilis]|uniref:Tetratricopeptide repeat protein n=1 Tax=Mucilaginibacter aquatilis TaxID=1517760 RepID=A0A6I4IQV7_9SPHI|nr:hypothetical protein [Mucilaginibacter aquatilis]MVN92373.1 hypothetical protein [Mucilaginibacter aquatilis]